MAKMVLRTTVFAWLCVPAFYGQENLCSVEYTKEGCAYLVTCNFKDKIVRGKTEFTISYRTDSGQDIIADCNWMRSENFSCDPATGYTCDLQSSGNFLVHLSTLGNCIKSGEFLFDVAHEEIFSCKIKPVHVISQDKTNSENASANANPESQNKCANDTDEKRNGPNRNKRSTDESEDRCQKGASEYENNTGMIIGVACTCLVAGLGVLLLVVKRRKLVAFVRKRKGHTGTCVEAPEYNTAFKDFENRECLMPETANSTKADTLEEKDDALGILQLRPGINYEVNKNIINTNPTEHDAVFDVSLVHYASSCNEDDNDCGISSEQT